MTPAALKSYRELRALGLPPDVWRKVSIGSDGKPDLSRLNDDEFDILLRAVRRVYPGGKVQPEVE
jgi:hypothetical protein